MIKVFSSNEKTIKAFGNGSEDCRNGSGNVYANGDTIYSYGSHFPLAIRIGGLYLINGDRYSNTTSKHTSLCIGNLKPNIQIPFSGLNSAGINPEKIKVIDNSPDTWTTQKYIDPKDGQEKERSVHHLGGVLFQYKKSFYLSGFDSQESVSRQSYFLTRLSAPADSFESAIEGLKPESVKQALQAGKTVKRQGEWFFIETEAETRKLKPVGRMIAIKPKNSHIATEVRKTADGQRLVRGFIRHRPNQRRGQHGILSLGKKWYEVVKNTARESWQASGLVD